MVCILVFEATLALNTLYLGQEKTFQEAEDERHEADDNAQTIRPNWGSPMSSKLTLAAAPPAGMEPIVEDYSDLAAEEDDVLQDKIADFKVCRVIIWESSKFHWHAS